jgi:hypothetical protein
MKKFFSKEAQAILQQAQASDSQPIAETDLLKFPEPMQRYLRYSQIVGKSPISTVRLQQKGRFKTQPSGAGMPFVAEQYFTINPPAFLWEANVSAFPLVSIAVKDSLSQGHGSISAKLLSLFSVASGQGREIDQGAWLRYLGEIGWFPTAWLSEQIEWQAIDTHSVQATIRDRDLVASAILHINPEGQLTRVSADRYRAAKPVPVLTPWSGLYSDYREVNGMMIPMHAIGAWNFETGDFAYFQGEVTEIEYNV